jgi:magnesium transporter
MMPELRAADDLGACVFPPAGAVASSRVTEPEPTAAPPERPEDETLDVDDLRDAWDALSADEQLEGFRLLPSDAQQDFFDRADARQIASVLLALPEREARLWFRNLEPDDAADVLQELAPDDRARMTSLLDETTRREVTALLAYAEDDAGGLMNPRFARVRSEMTVDEAISYLRRQARSILESSYYIYALDHEQKLLGVCSFRTLFLANPAQRILDIMERELITVPAEMDQEQVGRVVREHDLVALPVVDAEGRMKGVVTIDDIVDVVAEEATEDAQKFGGMEALDAPYLAERFWTMIKKRGGWLSALFVGELLTATAMASFEHEIDKAVVLALFVPLIISSGGNSGSQASTLVIRAMALGEVKLRDWWLVARRELQSGLVLGAVLGTLGLARVLLWQQLFGTYGPHALEIGLTVSISLIGVVLFGTMCGSMLPFLLHMARLDPASASAPFVATLVDVTGLLIYFSVAIALLSGTLL